MTSILQERDLIVPTARGPLAVDVFRPPDDEPRPVLLQYTAYNKSNWTSVYGVISPTRAVENGFVVVVVDALGRFGSGGDEPYQPFVDDGAMVVACTEWISQQPWCNGRIGMYGASNNGVPQWQAAREGASGLATIVPHFTASEFEDGWVYRGGAFQLGFNLWWTYANLAPDIMARAVKQGTESTSSAERLSSILSDPDASFARLPLSDLTFAEVPHYRDWLEKGPASETWAETSLEERWGEVELPVLHIAGWYNIHLDGSLANYVAMRTQAPEPVRGHQHLIIGPWTQWAPGLLGDACGPERRFATNLDMEGFQLSWFDHYLADGPPPGLPRVRAFVMGIDQWVDLPDWPVPSAEKARLYLRSEGDANTRSGGGALSWTGPHDDPADSFRYDPRDPVPSVGGAAYLPNPHANAGMRDQQAVEDRPDVLVYSTSPMPEPLVVVGPVSVTLLVTSTAPSTDFTAKLVDVHPDGRAMILCDGILRVAGLDPEAPTEIEIDMTATAASFDVGHRLRLEISSSNFPRYDRHTNSTGDPALVTEDDIEVALQTVHHTTTQPSYLSLDLIPIEELDSIVG